MNINDVAEFLDLVKNPEKYEKLLKNLKDEQDRLNAVIETVGKASELEKLRKAVEKQQESLQKDYDSLVEQHNVEITKEVELLANKRKVLQESQLKADAKMEQANAKFEQAKELEASFAGREKQLKQAEDGIRVSQQQADALIAEYSEKVAKLRSVMA